jgi:hypothetical protein
MSVINFWALRSVLANWAGNCFVLDAFLISITIDIRSGAIVVYDREGFPWSSPRFEETIDEPEPGRAIVLTMFLHCFITMVFGLVVKNCGKFAFGFDETCTFHFTPVCMFSFASDFGIFFTEGEKGFQLAIRSIEGRWEMTTEEVLAVRLANGGISGTRFSRRLGPRRGRSCWQSWIGCLASGGRRA